MGTEAREREEQIMRQQIERKVAAEHAEAIAREAFDAYGGNEAEWEAFEAGYMAAIGL